MKRTKMAIVALLAVLVLLVAALMGLMLVNNRNYIIDGRAYPKDAQSLDLRGEQITLQHYETVRSVLPDCEILWDVPLQAASFPSDSREVAVTDLQQDGPVLAWFPELETLDVTRCGDLSLLPALMEDHPGLKLKFALTTDGNTYTQDSRELTLTDVGQTELVLVQAMADLERVTVKEGGSTVSAPALKEYCLEKGIQTLVLRSGKPLTGDLTLDAVTREQAELLMLASELKTLHLTEPQAEAETLLTLRRLLPDTDVTWEKTVMGLTFRSDDSQIDLTNAIALEAGDKLGTKTAYEYALEQPVLGDPEEEPGSCRMLNGYPLPDKYDQTEKLLEEVEAEMAYFPDAEKLILCGAWLDNDVMAEYREAHRGEYKTVWSVRCGPLATRTDATFFMPTKYQIPYNGFTDLDAYNLRYCEELECIDVGHFEIANLDFVEYMPNLRYLDLTLTNVQDLSPLSSCKSLIYLTTAYARRIRDYTPLQGCTALQDLNIRGVTGDIAPILKMNWLNNLWIFEASKEEYQQAVEALPDTNIGYYGDSVSTWRKLPNYYAFRDSMLMFYMS